jgi:hypothetical protein
MIVGGGSSKAAGLLPGQSGSKRLRAERNRVVSPGSAIGIAMIEDSRKVESCCRGKREEGREEENRYR